MKWRIIPCAASKSAMTPSRSGRMASIFSRRAAEHLLGFAAYGRYLPSALNAGNGDDRRLIGDNAPASDINDSIHCAEVNAEISSKAPQNLVQHAIASPQRCAIR
jgi:hypothetical protein